MINTINLQFHIIITYLISSSKHKIIEINHFEHVLYLNWMMIQGMDAKKIQILLSSPFKTPTFKFLQNNLPTLNHLS
jgi:hypothetical protein